MDWLAWAEERYRRAGPGQRVLLSFENQEQWHGWRHRSPGREVKVVGHLINPLNGRVHVWILR